MCVCVCVFLCIDNFSRMHVVFVFDGENILWKSKMNEGQS